MQVLTDILHSNPAQTVISFFNSNFVLAVVGLCIFILYWLQIRDQKIAAASAIFSEIKNAEKLLKRVKEETEKEVLPEDINLMQVESWSQYKYLFIKDLDRDEWEAVNDFYNACKMIDEAISYNKTFFQKNEEQIRVNKHRVAAEYSEEAVELKGDEKSAFEKYAKFDKIFMEIKELYSPQKPVLDVQKYMRKINTSISFGSIGLKLKKLAKIKP